MSDFSNNTKSRRGRKPKIKESSENVIKKKRGRKKKCEMNLENTPKISGYNPNGDSIDTEDNKIKFGPTENFDNFENLNFGILRIKRHNIVSKKIEDEPKKSYDTNQCNINFNWIIDNIKSETNNDELPPKPKKENNLSQFFNVKPKEFTNTNKITNNVVPKKTNCNYIKILYNYSPQIPEKTDVWCWWCCHPFDNTPRFIPTKYDEIRQRFKVIGNFCSWSCAKTFFYNDQRYSTGSKSFMFSTLINVIHGRRYEVPYAPPKETLRVFGGKLSIEEFRNRDTNVYYEINTNRISMDDNYYIREIKKS